MFEIKGEFFHRNKWEVVFIDDEGDMMLAGDDSWQFTGTIVGIGDISPQWSNSKWRSLKIQQDEPTTIQRPERVSPWDIEPFFSFCFIQPYSTTSKDQEAWAS